MGVIWRITIFEIYGQTKVTFNVPYSNYRGIKILHLKERLIKYLQHIKWTYLFVCGSMGNHDDPNTLSDFENTSLYKNPV